MLVKTVWLAQGANFSIQLRQTLQQLLHFGKLALRIDGLMSLNGTMCKATTGDSEGIHVVEPRDVERVISNSQRKTNLANIPLLNSVVVIN